MNSPEEEQQMDHNQIPVQQIAPRQQGERFSEVVEPEKEKKRSFFNLYPSTRKYKKSSPDFEAFGESDDIKIEAFMKRFAHVAIAEQKKFGIPASLTMAHALLFSQVGENKPTQNANNYFGLICTEDWIGQSFKYKNKCYRQYESAWTSFRDHSLYITTGRFTSMNEAKGLDAQAWINLLSKSKFYENKKHPKELKAIMDKLDLSLLDQD